MQKTCQAELKCIVTRVTYHNPTTGWSVLRVQPVHSPQSQETVTVFQTKVFAGATILFLGAWEHHTRYGKQFKATQAIEKKPASTASIEKYIGSGLITGIGPKTAKRIVQHFKSETLNIFEHQTDRLLEVPGIAQKKLETIRSAWQTHRSIREIMMFLQSHGVSTLFSVRIFKKYGETAIEKVSNNPYQLADDFFGIGFFSADKIANSLGFGPNSEIRLRAGIKQILSASREQGHCYLSLQQIIKETNNLLSLNVSNRIQDLLEKMQADEELKLRLINGNEDQPINAYYANSIYFAENLVAEKILSLKNKCPLNTKKVQNWIKEYTLKKGLKLSQDQLNATLGVISEQCAILTGGPGVGKTTTTQIIVKLFNALGKKVILAAPTGRAAQRMSEVIGQESKTLHRLLEWKATQFNRNENNPLAADVIILDECSMIDITLMASFLRAVPNDCQLLLIGDADQLPPVGAGCVLRDLIASQQLPCFHLTQVFRQAKTSKIIKFAHKINQGITPLIESPFNRPFAWQDGTDCLFIDSAEATQKQLAFIRQVKRHFRTIDAQHTLPKDTGSNLANDPVGKHNEATLEIPKVFEHVSIEKLLKANKQTDELKAMIKKIPSDSSLHYGLSATDVVVKLILDWIPKYHPANRETQILSPMTKGSFGTANLNKLVQEKINPPAPNKAEIQFGGHILRVGDRVIHRRNNYDNNVYNGDIGIIEDVDNLSLSLVVSLFPNGRQVNFTKEDLMDLDLAYAITIHKSQGSEFDTVIMPLLSQHFVMLHKNLIYTGLTRAKKLSVIVGSRQALAMASQKNDNESRQTALQEILARSVIPTTS